MSEANKKNTNDLSLVSLSEKSTEEKRKDNLKKYFLDPNCIESLQDEIIRLKKELELEKEYGAEIYEEFINKCNKEYDRTGGLAVVEIKEGYTYSSQEVAVRFNLHIKTVTRLGKKHNIPILGKGYQFSGKFLMNHFKKDAWFSLSTKENTVVKEIELEDISGVVRSNTNIPKDNTKTYLIKNRRNGFYKIGRSKDPLKREQTLQSEEPDIVMVKTWDEDIESKLHIEYKDYRVRGEWFELSNTQVKYICTNYERSTISK